MSSSVVEAAQAPLADQGPAREPRPRPEDEDPEVERESDQADNTRRKKRRRKVAIKPGDKKFDCPEPDCGKKYSRAEHLNRHQLNHTPKEIYRCNHPNCKREFVRADLHSRHAERHTARGSHLQRRETFQNAAPTDASVSAPSSPTSRQTVSASPIEPVQPSYHQAPSTEYYPATTTARQASQASHDDFSRHPSSHSIPPVHNGAQARSSLDPQLTNGGSHIAFPAINGNYDSTMLPPATIPERRFSYDASYATQTVTNNDGYPQQQQQQQQQQHYEPITPVQPVQASLPHSLGTAYSQTYPSSSSTNYRSPTIYTHTSLPQSLPPLPPFAFQNGYGAQNSDRGVVLSQPETTPTDPNTFPNGRSDSFTNFNMVDMSPASYTFPVFGDEYGLNRSPPNVLSEDFLASLFGTNGMAPDSIIPTPPGPEYSNSQPVYSVPLPKIEPEIQSNNLPPLKQERPDTPAATGDAGMRESAVSEKKRLRLIDLINKRFTDSEQFPDRRPKDAIMNGCVDDPRHVLSLNMQRTFLTSYWAHVHQQMPMLHRPTFNPETCPDLLLLSMMCLGASCLERGYALEVTQRCAELASFLAYHVRWEVFKDAEFRPTAKLWTFQTMLLLELFEKMYSTHALHERAHIHHATTLTVMRRGSSLIGRSAIESPGHSNDPTRTPPGPDGSINTSGVNTSDARWNRWITAEATKRAAFAAFIIDSTHATLFGHSAVMAPHDIKIHLPCDESLWAATSYNEVERVEASLRANGITPISFIDGLRKTLNEQPVPTHTFGRVILMAGLLNVSWHMNARDTFQTKSLGLNNAAQWKKSLRKATEFWLRDFDGSLAKSDLYSQSHDPNTTRPNSPSGMSIQASLDTRDSVFESRTCLHALAHMSMHADMKKCTVFAGAERTLGRAVTEADRVYVRKYFREEWAPSAAARDAVFYALRFLREVLLPEQDQQRSTGTSAKFTSSPPQKAAFKYSARDDYLLNRPWVLYFAALIVWSYGYALDGPLLPSNYTLATREQQIDDMRHYLSRVGGVKMPDHLATTSNRNSCLGLLLLLRACFREPRWELLHDASDILDKCIKLLVPSQAASDGTPAKHAA